MVSVFKLFQVLVYQFYWKQSFQFKFQLKLLEYHCVYYCTRVPLPHGCQSTRHTIKPVTSWPLHEDPQLVAIGDCMTAHSTQLNRQWRTQVPSISTSIWSIYFVKPCQLLSALSPVPQTKHMWTLQLIMLCVTSCFFPRRSNVMYSLMNAYYFTVTVLLGLGGARSWREVGLSSDHWSHVDEIVAAELLTTRHCISAHLQ